MTGLRVMRILIGPILMRLTRGRDVMRWRRMRILIGFILMKGGGKCEQRNGLCAAGG